MLFFSVLTVFCILLLLSSLIPSSSLKKNVGESVNTFKNEGIYPSYGVVGRQIVLDNYTDSLMVNTAYSVDSSQPLRSAVSAVRRTESVNQTNQIVNLDASYTGRAKTPVFYERYWHGYLVYLRPLLVLIPYSGIRIVLSLLLYGLTAVFLYLVTKKLGILAAAIFFIGFLSVDLFYLGQSMQFSAVFFDRSCSLDLSFEKEKAGFGVHVVFCNRNAYLLSGSSDRAYGICRNTVDNSVSFEQEKKCSRILLQLVRGIHAFLV